MDALVAVRARLAAAIIGGEAPTDAALGTVTLQPHQLDGVRRLADAFRDWGGALLADAPGLGKTFVALALARESRSAIVVAPAALRTQWKRAADRAGVAIRWCSLETLSRRPVQGDEALLVVDEAHHLRNPATRRYAHAAALALGKKVLLLTATPVHNRAADRDALLSLFLGTRAGVLDAHDLARLVVRREASPLLLPQRRATHWLRAPTVPGIAAALRALPPPLPAADGRVAGALVRMTLAHAWSSSIAALDDAARRALHRDGALDDALAAGRWPTRRELGAWATSVESSQLAFAQVVATPTTADAPAARDALAAHAQALRALRVITSAQVAADSEARAGLLRRILRRHRGATIVAFTRHAATVNVLWGQLRLEPGVVAVTASSVRSAGGGLRRAELLEALTSVRPCDGVLPLRLVISTDLMGEGLDLRAASVVVHLDQPWTPALLDQREGRAARLASPHATIAVYALRPPGDATRLLRLAARLDAKRCAMRAGTSAGSAREALLALVRPWSARRLPRARLAAARCGVEGWVAAVRDQDGKARVLASTSNGNGPAEDDAALLEILRRVQDARPVVADPERVRTARRAIRRWLDTHSAARLASADDGSADSRAAMARRLDAALRDAPLHQRGALQERILTARSRITALRGAGAERALAEATRLKSTDALLSALERLRTSPGAPSARPTRPQLLALLLLTRE